MKVLVVSFWCPYPPDNGSRLRAYHLIRQLARRGHEIKLLALAQPETDQTLAQEKLTLVCRLGVALFASRFFQPGTLKAISGFLSPQPRHLIDTYSKKFAEAVAQECLSGDYAAVLALELGAAHYVPLQTSLPCLLDQLEVSPFVKAVSEAPVFKSRLRRRLTLYKLRSHIRSLSSRYVLWTTVSEREAQTVQELTGISIPAIKVLPNGTDLEDNTYDPHAEYDMSRLVYNGSPTFDANADAVHWFGETILPIIQKECPEACLDVTGRSDTLAESDSLRHISGVTLTGFLEDIRPVVQRAAVCVVPLRQGGGTRLKILEAMALGVPVVSTPLGAEGIDVTDGKDILLAGTPEEFAAAVLSVMCSPRKRAEMAASGRRLVESQYGWDALGSQLEGYLLQAIGERKRTCL